MSKNAIRIGWSTRDVTPEGTVRVMGQFHVRVSTGIESPLSCTAMAIEGGDGAHALLVSVDAPYVVDEVLRECRRRVVDETSGLDAGNICVFTTHTHTAACHGTFWYPEDVPEGVVPDEQYARKFTDNLVAVATEAWNAREPAQLAWGWAEAVIGHNRRVHYKDGSAGLYGATRTPEFSHMEGGSDPSVNLLYAYDGDGKLAGVVVNLACPAQTQEAEPFISADFWHDARKEIRSRHGEEIFILPQCGFAGDQSPHPMLHHRAHLRMLELGGVEPAGYTFAPAVTSAQCRAIGRRIAGAIDETVETCSATKTDDVPFAHTHRMVDLPRRIVTAEDARKYGEEAAECRAQLATLTPDPADAEYTSCHSRVIYNERVVQRYEQQDQNPTYSAEIHVLRVGDMAMTFASPEVYLDFGFRIQELSPAAQTFTVQLLSQESDNPGYYLPTERAVEAGDYGGNIRDSLIGPDGGQVLVDAIVEMLDALWKP